MEANVFDNYTERLRASLESARGVVGLVVMNWMGKQGGEGYEYHLLAIAALATILIVGPGRFALARYLPLPRKAFLE